VLANKPCDAVVFDLLLAANDGISLLHTLHGQTATRRWSWYREWTRGCAPPVAAWRMRPGSVSPGRWKSRTYRHGCGRGWAICRITAPHPRPTRHAYRPPPR
jgi:hypothetical protein